MLYVAPRAGAKPSQMEGSNLGVVLLQVRGSQLRAKLGELSHAVAANADGHVEHTVPRTTRLDFVDNAEVKKKISFFSLKRCAGSHSPPPRCPLAPALAALCTEKFINRATPPLCAAPVSLFLHWNLFND